MQNCHFYFNWEFIYTAFDVSKMGHTLLVFFSSVRSHCWMMLIHLASLCLTNSGGGPTLLTQKRTNNHIPTELKDFTVSHPGTVQNTRLSNE